MMKIEITIGNEDPVTYVLPHSQIILGKDSECDVVVLDPKISRNHLKIEFQNGHYFLTDLGSTNGTYINEERISEGQKVELLSFFPARLGSNVLLSVINDETQTADQVKEEKTQVVSLRDLQSANTSRLLKNKKRKLKNKRKQQNNLHSAKLIKRYKQYFTFKMLMAYVILGYGLIITINKTEDVSLNEVKSSVNITQVNENKKNEKASPIKFEVFDKHLSEEKCKGSLEKQVCEAITLTKIKPWGAMVEGQTIYIQVNASEYHEEALRILRNRNENKNEAWNLTSALFLSQGVHSNLDYTKLKGYSIAIALYIKPEKTGLAAVIRILPESLENVKVLLNKERIDAVGLHGMSVIDFANNYYSVLTAN